MNQISHQPPELPGGNLAPADPPPGLPALRPPLDSQATARVLLAICLALGALPVMGLGVLLLT